MLCSTLHSHGRFDVTIVGVKSLKANQHSHKNPNKFSTEKLSIIFMPTTDNKHENRTSMETEATQSCSK